MGGLVPEERAFSGAISGDSEMTLGNMQTPQDVPCHFVTKPSSAFLGPDVDMQGSHCRSDLQLGLASVPLGNRILESLHVRQRRKTVKLNLCPTQPKTIDGVLSPDRPPPRAGVGFHFASYDLMILKCLQF